MIAGAGVALLAHEDDLDRGLAGILAHQPVQTEQDQSGQAAIEDQHVRIEAGDERLRFVGVQRGPRGDAGLAERVLVLSQPIGVSRDDVRWRAGDRLSVRHLASLLG